MLSRADGNVRSRPECRGHVRRCIITILRGRRSTIRKRRTAGRRNETGEQNSSVAGMLADAHMCPNVYRHTAIRCRLRYHAIRGSLPPNLSRGLIV